MVKKGRTSALKANSEKSRHDADDLGVDSILIRAIKRGDESAFELLLTRYQPAIHRFAYRFLADADAANDVAQETFLRFYLLVKNDREIEHLSALLFKIARNCCVDVKRKRRLRSLQTDEMPIENRTALQVLDEKERHFRIETAIQGLTENQRAVILLRHMESLSYQEIARVMSTSVSAVESLLFRARSRLRKMLERDEAFNS